MIKFTPQAVEVWIFVTLVKLVLIPLVLNVILS